MFCALEIKGFINFIDLNIQAKLWNYYVQNTSLRMKTVPRLFNYKNKYTAEKEIFNLTMSIEFFCCQANHTEELTSYSLPEQSIPRQPDGQTQTHSWRFNVPPLRHFNGHSERIKQDRSDDLHVADVLFKRAFIRKYHLFAQRKDLRVLTDH